MAAWSWHVWPLTGAWFCWIRTKWLCKLPSNLNSHPYCRNLKNKEKNVSIHMHTQTHLTNIPLRCSNIQKLLVFFSIMCILDILWTIKSTSRIRTEAACNGQVHVLLPGEGRTVNISFAPLHPSEGTVLPSSSDSRMSAQLSKATK